MVPGAWQVRKVREAYLGYTVLKDLPDIKALQAHVVQEDTMQESLKSTVEHRRLYTELMISN
jgi:hypothetical protein